MGLNAWVFREAKFPLYTTFEELNSMAWNIFWSSIGPSNNLFRILEVYVRNCTRVWLAKRIAPYYEHEGHMSTLYMNTK
jgi:hypothetical protein